MKTALEKILMAIIYLLIALIIVSFAGNIAAFLTIKEKEKEIETLTRQNNKQIDLNNVLLIKKTLLIDLCNKEMK